MKLLIFGDSYGEKDLIAYPSSHPVYKHLPSRSFHTVLLESGAFDDVTTFAVGGSDLWSQYKLFQKHYTGNEFVVWFETACGRISLENGINLTGLDGALQGLWEHTKGMYKGGDTTHSVIYRAAIDYYQYIEPFRQDLDKFIHACMIEEIKKSCPTALFIPCFHDSITVTASNNKSCMGYVYGMENKVWGISDEKRVKLNQTHFDLRRNHITLVNHEILASEILRCFKESDTSINFDRFVSPEPKDYKKYFIQRPTKISKEMRLFKIFSNLLREWQYRRRLKEMRKRDPFIY